MGGFDVAVEPDLDENDIIVARLRVRWMILPENAPPRVEVTPVTFHMGQSVHPQTMAIPLVDVVSVEERAIAPRMRVVMPGGTTGIVLSVHSEDAWILGDDNIKYTLSVKSLQRAPLGVTRASFDCANMTN